MRSSEDESGKEQVLRVLDLIEVGAEFLGLELLAGDGGLDRRIEVPRIQKAGLAMTGYVDFVGAGRIQVFGRSELAYLATLDGSRREPILRRLCQRPIPCIAVTRELEPPAELVALCREHDVPLLRSHLQTSFFGERISLFLDAHLAPGTVVHGVLVEVYGTGVLITGPSGIGKSECALDLVVRGHRLVSDDVVEIRRRQGDILVGRGPELIRHHMEIRGLGIIRVADLFGAAASRQQKRVEMVVELTRWEKGTEYERLGIDSESTEVLGVELPRVRLPVTPGRNLSILIEIATRTLLLKRKGIHPARDLEERLQMAMEEPRYEQEPYDPDAGDVE